MTFKRLDYKERERERDKIMHIIFIYLYIHAIWKEREEIFLYSSSPMV